MRIDIISAVPELLGSAFSHSIMKRAIAKGLAEINTVNLRDYATNKQKQIDDYAFGGGAGMVLMIEPIAACINDLKLQRDYDEVIYMSATEEMRHTVAQANATLDADGRFVDELISTRQAGDFTLNPVDAIDLIDVSPKQLVSVAASLIPFLENDDANRALMGSNMQRQAVPLVRAEAPFVGTGMEETVARDSGAAISATRASWLPTTSAVRHFPARINISAVVSA